MTTLPAGRNTSFDIRLPFGTAPGVPPYAARGLKGTLRPIDMAQGSGLMRRTVNGTLVDISAPQMRKYQLEASGEDMDPPALDALWPGMALDVDCHVEMAYLTASGGPARTPVPGSERVEGDYSFYSPQMAMLLVEFSIDRDEYGAAVSWSLTLEEI